MNRGSCCLLAVIWLCSAPAAAVETGDLCGHALAGFVRERSRFDEATGEDQRHYPPHVQVDFQHLRLDLAFENLTTRSFRGTETLTFRTLAEPIQRLHLDAVGLGISRVTDLAGRPLSFRYDGERLTVRFEPAIAPATDAGIRIEYECRDPARGMVFALPDAAYPDRPVAVHTQGQPDDSRYWFICHDFPNERFTSEVLATIPAGYIAVSNGRLVERAELDGNRVRYHYLQEQPHVAYLVSLVIGEFAVVHDEWRGKPVEYCVPPHQEKHARLTFGKTPKMMDLFSRITGIDYPYAKYAQTVCYEFRPGGMEHTSATTMHEMIVTDERAALDDDEEELISHELAHMWFGDMVTCKSWPHVWLNEGFATFMAHVWEEHERGLDEYEYEIRLRMQEVVEKDSVEAPAGLVFAEFDNPGDIFRRPVSNPYTKGACVLHMLRRDLGDELFWRCVANWLKRYAWQAAETDDFRKVIEELTARSFERFFQQWVYRPGTPHLTVDYEWDDERSEARIRLEQTQEITREAPAFVADIDAWLVFDDGRIDRHVVPMERRFAGLSVRCLAEPAQVCIDPRGALLARFKLNQPVQMLVRQALAGPTTAARLQAAGFLADKDDRKARDALRTMVRDEKSFWGLRAEAARALGTMQHSDARDVLLAALDDPAGLPDHRVRRAAVEALGRYREERVVPTLLRFARRDASYQVEAAASAALGNQQPTDEIIAVLTANCGKTSHRDRIRCSAIEALSRLDDPRGIDPAMELAAYGAPFRSRPTGIEALGRLGRLKDHTDRVRRFLEPLLKDRHERVVWSAITALAELRDEKAIPALRAFADSSAWKPQRDAAGEAINAIVDKSGDTEAIHNLRERIDRLEAARREMEKKLSALQGDPDSDRKPTSSAR